MTKAQVIKIVEKLEEMYPDATCALTYSAKHELLIAARLSAQCTDARVNIITPALFERFKTPKEFAEADIKEVERYIESCGLYHTKAIDIIEMCKRIVNVYNGEVPGNIDDLLTLRGVGRKTANLIMGDIYGQPAIVTDTHCIRISYRLGLTKNKEPVKVEKDLKMIIPSNKQSDFCHRLVLHGRALCKARKPECEECALSDICKKNNYKDGGNKK